MNKIFTFLFNLQYIRINLPALPLNTIYKIILLNLTRKINVILSLFNILKILLNEIYW